MKNIHNKLTNIDSRRLQVFLAVAKNLSFTKAAEELAMTQPAVTSQIRQLEEAFNVELFYRAHNKVTLTDVGLTLKEFGIKRAIETEAFLHSIDAGEEFTPDGGHTIDTLQPAAKRFAIERFRDNLPDETIIRLINESDVTFSLAGHLQLVDIVQTTATPAKAPPPRPPA